MWFVLICDVLYRVWLWIVLSSSFPIFQIGNPIAPSKPIPTDISMQTSNITLPTSSYNRGGGTCLPPLFHSTIVHLEPSEKVDTITTHDWPISFQKPIPLNLRLLYAQGHVPIIKVIQVAAPQGTGLRCSPNAGLCGRDALGVLKRRAVRKRLSWTHMS